MIGRRNGKSLPIGGKRCVREVFSGACLSEGSDGSGCHGEGGGVR